MVNEETTNPKTGPLATLKVLDLTRVIAGPLAGQMLADLGADVVKVERPMHGDDVRHLGPPWMTTPDGKASAEATYYSVANRGKRSVTIDFAQPAGAQLVKRLAAESDILLENFRPGTLEKYGLDYASLSATHPRLIYCSVTGFGQTGPYRERAGYDFLMQGMAGVMSVTGKPGSGPTRAGVPIADYSAGLMASIGILAALNHRHQTGRGQQVDIALFDSQFSMMLNVFSGWFNGGVSIEQTNDHPSACPHGVFPTADGHIIIATMSDAQFVRLAALLGHPEWATDSRFITNGRRVVNCSDLIARISEVLATRPSAHWLAALDSATIPAGPINRIRDLANDPQLAARGMFVNFPSTQYGEIQTIGNPVNLSDSPVSYGLRPPVLGEHTNEILGGRLGLSEQKISGLQARGVI